MTITQPTRLDLARRGWWTFPLVSTSKTPAVRFLTASTLDPQVIIADESGRPGGNYGIGLGRSGLIAIDEDVTGGVQLMADSLGITMPPTYTVATGKGRHLYLQAPPVDPPIGNSTALVPFGCDVRGFGGYVVAPGSTHESGAVYTVTDDADPAECPPELVDLLMTEGASDNTAVDAFLFADDYVPMIDGIPEVIVGKHHDAPGQRHETIMRYASSLRARSAPLAEAQILVESVWRRCEQPPQCLDPMPWTEARDTVEDMYRRHPAGRSEAYRAAPVLAPLDVEGEGAFWSTRPSLALIHEWARATSTAPWALFAAVGARLLAAVPVHIVLPATIGATAGLNTWFALVGASGTGKGNASAVAPEVLDLDPLYPVKVIGIGSGEGLAHLFVRREGKGKESVIVQHTSAALVEIPEIDTLAALATRSGSTMWPELRKAWTGEALGFQYADELKRLTVGRHTYRLTMIVGVQPGRAAALMDDHAGGTPQRMIFLPATDGAAPVTPPPRPTGKIHFRPTDLMRGGSVTKPMTLPLAAVEQIQSAQHDRLTGRPDALDGHRLLAQAKIAALLSIMDTGRADRMTITVQDWSLAAVVMGVSDSTRAEILTVLADERTRSNTSRGRSEGERRLVADLVVTTDAAGRVAGRLMKILAESGDEWLTRRGLRAKIAGRDRKLADEVLGALIDSGQVEVDLDDPDRPRYRAAARRR